MSHFTSHIKLDEDRKILTGGKMSENYKIFIGVVVE
jgi:hypothetical protein